MLQNNGPYGPSDVPVNMGVSSNINQISGHMNIAHNLHYSNKIPQIPPQLSSGHYSLPNYSNYGYPAPGVNAIHESYPDHYPVGLQPSYLDSDPPVPMDNNWQNTALHQNRNHNLHQNVNSVPNPYYEISRTEQNLQSQSVLNIPSFKVKTFDNAVETTKNIPETVEEREADEYARVFHGRSQYDLLDSQKRKSLENTVKLIENILINSSPTSKPNPVTSDVKTTVKSINCLERNVENFGISSKLSHNKTIVESSTEKIIPKTPKIENTEKSAQDFTKNKLSPQYNKPTEEIAQNFASETKEIENNIELECIFDPDSDVEVKQVMETSVDPSVVVKVEKMFSWPDSDGQNPFLRDMNGILPDNAENCKVISGDMSIDAAKEAIHNGPSNLYYECPHCGLLFRYPKRFLIHTKWHSFGLTHIMRIETAKDRQMQKRMKREATFMARLNSSEVKEYSEGDKVFPCNYCEKVFSTRGSIRNHKKRFHPTPQKTTRECKMCGLKLYSYSEHRAHMATHVASEETGNKFLCQDCPKTFKHRHSLVKHRATHAEKVHQCLECPKKFGSKILLKLHNKVHERHKRGATFRCSYCPKSFYENYNVVAHERVHTNERPFKCDKCGTSFATSSGLKRHVKVSHSSNKPFECDVCHRSFAKESIRDHHQIRYHGNPEDLKCECKYCPARYVTMKVLNKHISKAHPRIKTEMEVEDSD